MKKQSLNNDQIDQRWDNLLRIKTSGRDDSNADQYRYPYEPTPYSVLERLSNSGYIGKKNVVVDYGCGKGRVDFMLSYQNRCQTIGIEYDQRIYESAVKNKETAVSGGKTTFLCQDATDYIVPPEADRFFFFNPFSVEILLSVISRIIDSYYDNPREILLFFYYPQKEYIGHLMLLDEFTFVDEIDCMDLFEGNDSRERIVVFGTN